MFLKQVSLPLACCVAMLAGCATPPAARVPWPATVVAIEEVKPVKPMAISYFYNITNGRPAGTCVLRIHVDSDGRAQKVDRLESSGHTNLDEAFVKAAWKAQYQPYVRDGQAIDVTVIAPFHAR
ncbi:TonB family protein [Sphaerotilus hippei]|uniref:TonB family protein n=1 Tax=Sphaerotilus hippei TaxID=744406 RepID=A0A318H1H6_9BURK|nr:energy transducer TonB [Sphaerotilus hippei]PXW94390.1 TonB family protein [Sphaerotilus hippei]